MEKKLVCKDRDKTEIVGERIRRIREHLNLSQAELAELVGVSQQSVHEVESGEILIPRNKNLIRYALALNTTKEYLLLGIEKNDSIIKVPLVDWPTKSTSNFTSSKVHLEIPFSKEFVGDNSYALKVKDDTMYNPTGRGSLKSFREDEIIIVDPEIKPKAGSLVIATPSKSAEPIFKQLVIDGNKWYLRPFNPQYPAIQMTATGKILGVVVAYQGLLV